MKFDRFVLMFVGACCVASLLGAGCEGGSDDASSSGGVAADAISVDEIVWLDTDVSDWEITSTLNVSLSGSLIIYDQDGTAKWPEVDGSTGNPWVFIYQDGVWYGATDEWMLPSQTHKNKSSVSGSHIKEYGYFSSSWVPTAGVEYGFMVSGLARSDTRNVSERTQIQMMTWE
ncbi:hypothetical protein ACFLQR_02005 [Verrucomicrobiota bacterium]